MSQLPEGDLVFCLRDGVPKLDVSPFSAFYAQAMRGGPPFDPAMLVCLLLYAYGVGVFSSRKIALACERHWAFLAIVGEDRPDFRTISDFRTVPLEACKAGLVQVVRWAGAAGLVPLGTVATEGTTIQGHASRHKAMSYGSMKKAVERIREDIAALVTHASPQEEAEEAAWGSRRGDEWPAELARRAARLANIEAARRRLEAEAKAEADAERQRRVEADAEPQRSGKQRRGKAPQESDETPADKAQMSCTDPALHSMQTTNKGGDYCGNAHASVDGAYQIMVACDVTDATHATPQAAPMGPALLEPLKQADMARRRNEAGEGQAIPATLASGSDSEAAPQALEA